MNLDKYDIVSSDKILELHNNQNYNNEGMLFMKYDFLSEEKFIQSYLEF